jgi:hypothetical protein
MTSFVRNNQAKRWRGLIRIAIHIDGDDDLLISGAESDAAQRADIAEITAPCEREVSGGRHQIIGRVQVHPAQFLAAPDGEPGMRGIGPDQFLLTGGRQRFQVAADIASGQPHAAQAGDHHLSVILAHAALFFPRYGDRSGGIGGGGIEGEVAKNAMIQIKRGIEDRSSGREAFARILTHFWEWSDERGIADKLGSCGGGGPVGGQAKIAHRFPCRRGERIGRGVFIDVNQAVRDDFQFIVRAFDFEVGNGIAIGIVPFMAMQRFRANGDFVPRAFLIRQPPRSQFGMVMADTDGAIVAAESSVMDTIAHA